MVGIATGDMGVDKSGAPGPNFQPGMELRARCTIFAEGCRGSLTKRLLKRFNLRDGRDPQTYGIGVKELWEVPKETHKPGLIVHTIGWPLDFATYGGSFLYHFGDNLVAYGFVVGPRLQQPLAVAVRGNAAAQDPSGHAAAFRGRAAHRLRRAGARRGRLPVAAAADLPRRLPGRRHRRVPQRAEDQGHPHRHEVRHAGRRGGGRDAGRPSRPSLPPIPNACRRAGCGTSCTACATSARASPNGACWGGLVNAALDTYVLRGRAPWTLHHREPDNATLRPASEAPPIDYPKPDGVLTFDRLSSVFISNTDHEENQPAHLHLRDPARRDRGELGDIPQPGDPLLPGRRLRNRRRRGGRAAAADQLHQLRALQDLRHQGPDPEHRLGDAGGRRRAGLSGRDVNHSVAPALHRHGEGRNALIGWQDADTVVQFTGRSCSPCRCCRPAPRPIRCRAAARRRLAAPASPARRRRVPGRPLRGDAERPRLRGRRVPARAGARSGQRRAAPAGVPGLPDGRPAGRGAAGAEAAGQPGRAVAAGRQRCRARQLGRRREPASRPCRGRA